jgi:hypothetical protein
VLDGRDGGGVDARVGGLDQLGIFDVAVFGDGDQDGDGRFRRRGADDCGGIVRGLGQDDGLGEGGGRRAQTSHTEQRAANDARQV